MDRLLFFGFRITPNKSHGLFGGPARLVRDAGFATFCDGIMRNWVLKLRETGLDTPTVPGMSLFSTQ